MSDSAGNPSGNGVSGAGAGNPGSAGDSVDVAALVNEAVNKALGARLKRIDLEGQIGKAVEAAIAKVSASTAEKPQEPQATPAGDHADGKLTMKALQEQVANLNKQLQTQQKAAQDAEARAKDIRMRGEVERAITNKLGAGNPLIPHLMDSLYDVKKRFVENDGRLSVKFNDAGYDDFKPLDDGINALFDGELKAIVQQSKAKQLPPNQIGRLNGSPVPSIQQLQQQTNKRINPLLGEIALGIAQERPEAAQILLNDASNMGPTSK